MRRTETSGWIVPSSSRALRRALWLAVIALGIGVVMTAGAARAQDDDDEDEKTFEEKIIEGIMAGIGGTNMENRGIDYRERSPLVVPPKLDLPPPASATADVKAPNWPKDPDEAKRKAAIAARKKENKDPREASRILTPSELAQGKTAAPARTNNDPIQPGNSNTNPILSPSQLGYNGSFSGLFGGNKSETAPFKGEPSREALTQPPTGYQTPSPNFAYGTGPKESMNKEYNPAAGKYGE
jgi:type IV secretory pathway VirB10-like protein